MTSFILQKHTLGTDQCVACRNIKELWAKDTPELRGFVSKSRKSRRPSQRPMGNTSAEFLWLNSCASKLNKSILTSDDNDPPISLNSIKLPLESTQKVPDLIFTALIFNHIDRTKDWSHQMTLVDEGASWTIGSTSDSCSMDGDLLKEDVRLLLILRALITNTTAIAIQTTVPNQAAIWPMLSIV